MFPSPGIYRPPKIWIILRRPKDGVHLASAQDGVHLASAQDEREKERRVLGDSWPPWRCGSPKNQRTRRSSVGRPSHSDPMLIPLELFPN